MGKQSDGAIARAANRLNGAVDHLIEESVAGIHDAENRMVVITGAVAAAVLAFQAEVATFRDVDDGERINKALIIELIDALNENARLN